MKLTLKQRMIVLFTGRVGEKSADTVDASTVKPTPIMPPKAVVIPERKRATATAASTEPKRRKPRHSKYAEQAKACRMHPECWQQVATTPVRSTANALVSKIRHGGLVAFKKPRGGHYDARLTPCMSEYLVEAKFIPNKKENTK